MWVQSWDGKRWVSYDAALGEFDAGHIALVIGDGSLSGPMAMNAIARRMRIVDALALAAAVPASVH